MWVYLWGVTLPWTDRPPRSPTKDYHVTPVSSVSVYPRLCASAAHPLETGTAVCRYGQCNSRLLTPLSLRVANPARIAMPSARGVPVLIDQSYIFFSTIAISFPTIVIS